jgi:hypothetical protein
VVRCWTAGLCVLGLVGVVPGTAVGAVTNAVWSTAVPATVPSGGGQAALSAISCASPGECAAVGSYVDGSGDEQALVLSQASGIWEQGARVSLTAAAASDPRADLTSVSCASPGECSAVGSYRDDSGDEQGLLVTESSGVWGHGVTASLPADAATNPEIDLASVSCAAPGECSAIGSYRDSSGDEQGLLVTESSGVWGRGVTASLPADAATNPEIDLSSASCASPGDCSAVGSYQDGSGDEQALVLTQTAGIWGPGTPAQLPSGASSEHASAGLASVSCSGAGDCTAVGQYNDSEGYQQGLLVTETAGTWGPAVKAPLPAAATPTNPPFPTAGNPVGAPSAVACSSPGTCSAAGSYGQLRVTSCCKAAGFGLLLGQAGGAWAQGVTGALPAGATDNSDDTRFPVPVLGTVSCGDAGDCTAAGAYQTDRYPAGQFDYDQLPLLTNETESAWGSGLAPVLPADAQTTGDRRDGITEVSCAEAGSCGAVGYYSNSTGENEGMLLSSRPGVATPTLSVSAPQYGVVGAPIAPKVGAILSSQAGPTGAIAFTVFGPSPTPPSACVTGGEHLGSTYVQGVGTYKPQGSYAPPVAGDYWWYAQYGGDDNDEPAASACGSTMAETIANPQTTRKPAPPPESTPGRSTPARRTSTCPKPSGRLTATGIGPLALGKTRHGARRRLTHYAATSDDSDRFCLVDGAIRVFYASSRTSRDLPAHSRRKLQGKIILALTANPHYAIKRVSAGTPLRTAERRLKLGRSLTIGRSRWYIIVERRSTELLEVKRSRISEVGVADRAVARTRTELRELLHLR